MFNVGPMNLGTIIKLMRERRGMTMTQLAQAAEIDTQAVNALEKRDSRTSLHVLKLAKALRVTPESLMDGSCLTLPDAQLLEISNVWPNRRVPLLDKVPAGNWRQSFSSEASQTDDWVPCPDRCSAETYALRVSGVSMEPEYAHGDIIIVDPMAEAVHGSDVVVRQDGDDHTFKRLIVERDGFLLKALNENWPGPKIMPLAEDATIAGVVIGQYRDKRKA